MDIFYYKSDYYWVSGWGKSIYEYNKKTIIVNGNTSSKHKTDDRMVVKIGDKIVGENMVQDSNEIIPVSQITKNSFVIDCDNYVKINNISAFNFPDNFILAPEDNWCNQAYDESGNLMHLKISLKKLD